MAKLYFKYGVMGSSKTANALMTKFNYEEKGKRVWLIKPAIDTRDNVADKVMIGSRIGLKAEAQAVRSVANLYEMFSVYQGPLKMHYDAIICDECQFLTAEQVDELKAITDKFDVPVLCFGLRSDFRTMLFEGSKRLFEIADSISEIKSICRCSRKAIVNARLNKSGKVVREGPQIEIGGNEKYEALCWSCWKKLLSKE